MHRNYSHCNLKAAARLFAGEPVIEDGSLNIWAALGGGMWTKVALVTLSLGIALPEYAIGQVSDGVVRIGLLTDYTGVFSALSGQGGVIAARMAVEDFGGT